MFKIIYLTILVLIISGCSMKNGDIGNNDRFIIKNQLIKYGEKETPVFMTNSTYSAGAVFIFNNIESSSAIAKLIFLKKNGDEATFKGIGLIMCTGETNIVGDIIFKNNDIYLSLNNICVQIKR